MAELWVGKGQSYGRLSEAVRAAHSGDVIYVKAGLYKNDFTTIDKDLTIVGVGGKAHLAASGLIGNGKAILITRADVTLDNIEFSGARVADHNGAGIRYEKGSLTIKDSYFHHNENGLLAAPTSAGRITITDSEFDHNGRGDGRTHGVYVNKLAKLTIENSEFHDTDGGHHLKSRALATEVRGSTFDDGSGDSAYAIDLPNGGAAVVMHNTLIQGSHAGNKYVVHYGGETSAPYPGTLVLADNDFVNHAAKNAVAVLNQTSRILDIRDNDFVDFGKIVTGPAHLTGNLLGKAGAVGSHATPQPAPTPATASGSAAGAEHVHHSDPGPDTLYGALGKDLFVYKPDAGADVIWAFGKEDVIDVQAYHLSGFAELHAMLHESSSGAMLDLPGADSILLKNRTVASLQSDDFIV
jgi:hypothetical protein